MTERILVACKWSNPFCCRRAVCSWECLQAGNPLLVMQVGGYMPASLERE